jgi:very-short-patch-repair endonuclease
MRKEIAKVERLIALIAARQHGVISYEQLIWAGLSPAGITRRVRTGRLHRLYRGVYAVGHTNLSRDGRWLAAVLACGRGAVLSHESAAHLWNLSPRSPSYSHVSVPSRNGRKKRRGIRLHYRADLGPADTTRRHNIPVTTSARTRRDMGWTKEPTRSHLERKFLTFLRAHDLPIPSVNQRIGPYTVDFLWPERRLVVELDGYAYHSDRASFEADRRRDRELQTRGYVVLRFTYREVMEDPEAVVAALWAHLRRRPRH